jgi:hypothetical protein
MLFFNEKYVNITITRTQVSLAGYFLIISLSSTRKY